MRLLDASVAILRKNKYGSDPQLITEEVSSFPLRQNTGENCRELVADGSFEVPRTAQSLCESSCGFPHLTIALMGMHTIFLHVRIVGTDATIPALVRIYSMFVPNMQIRRCPC